MPLLHLIARPKIVPEELRGKSDFWDDLTNEVVWDVVPRIGETVALPCQTENGSFLLDYEVQRVYHWFDDKEITLSFSIGPEDYLELLKDGRWEKDNP